MWRYPCRTSYRQLVLLSTKAARRVRLVVLGVDPVGGGAAGGEPRHR